MFDIRKKMNLKSHNLNADFEENIYFCIITGKIKKKEGIKYYEKIS
jgi:hypothetical protein